MLALGLTLLIGCAAPPAAPVYQRATDPPRAAPQPVAFPRDEAPHDDLTEWWYYTGHLFADDGARYGFEFVVFQVVRGEYPVVYVAHMAVTDGPRDRFWHDQRVQLGSQIGRDDGFDLDVSGWRLQGALGRDAIAVQADALACGKIHVRSVAQLIGEAVRRIHEEESISSLFVV